MENVRDWFDCSILLYLVSNEVAKINGHPRPTEEREQKNMFVFNFEMLRYRISHLNNSVYLD